jgi:hypothetical protein
VSDLARWPERLPHYRYVRFEGKDPGGRDLVAMSARRSGLRFPGSAPMKPTRSNMNFASNTFANGLRGMRVVWTLTPTRDGTRVEIVHDLKFRIRPSHGSRSQSSADFFIDNIASKTLKTFKQLLESEAQT